MPFNVYGKSRCFAVLYTYMSVNRFVLSQRKGLPCVTGFDKDTLKTKDKLKTKRNMTSRFDSGEVVSE